MFKFVIPAVAALGLVAFAAQSESFGPRLTLQSDVQPMGWHLSHEGAMAKLAYGVANSDQLALMLTCEPGQSTAVVYGDVQPASLRLVQASMGPSAIDPMTGASGETRISLRDPALLSLAAHGEMPIESDAGQTTLSATDGEQQVVSGFLAYCGSSQA